MPVYGDGNYTRDWLYVVDHASAIDLVSSSTRRDDLLLDENTIQRMWIMRKYLADMNPVEAMEFINDRFKKTKNNEEFLISMNS